MGSAVETPTKRKADIYDLPKSNTKNKKQKQSSSAYADDIPFTIHCPPKPGEKEVHEGEVEIADGVLRKFSIVTHDGTKWQNIKSYRNVKLGDSTFGKGDVVYILNNPTPPDPPKEDEGEEAFLKWDRKNTFVGEIIEARAESADKVYVLIVYLYWPEEIPAQQKKTANWGGKNYARGELIKSDFFEIIDATSISSKGEVPRWDEENDEAVAKRPERFWRQRFDKSKFDKTPTSPSALTPLRKFCKCSKPYNPDTSMFHHTTSCNAWNHEDCLIDDIGSKIWEPYSAGNMEEYAKLHTPQLSKSTLKNIGKKLQAKVEEVVDDVIDTISPNAKRVKSEDEKEVTIPAKGVGGRPTKAISTGKGRPKKPLWPGKLNIIIVADDEDAPLKAIVKERKTDKSWEIKVDCLTCGKTMD